MAGRPLKMAEKAAEFEDAAICLSGEVFLAMPGQYRRDPMPDDPLCRAWNDCVRATMCAVNACERLGDLLRERAGITEPGPTKEFFADEPLCSAPVV